MKYTKEKWESEGTTIYALHQKGWDKGKPRMSNRFYAGVYGDVSGANPITMEEIYGNVKLITKAPEMLEALKGIYELRSLIYYDPETTKAEHSDEALAVHNAMTQIESLLKSIE